MIRQISKDLLIVYTYVRKFDLFLANLIGVCYIRSSRPTFLYLAKLRHDALSSNYILSRSLRMVVY